MSKVMKTTNRLWVSSFALPVVLALPASTALAKDPPKKFSKQESQVEATQTNLTKPEAPPANKKEEGPKITAEQFVEKKAADIQSIVDKQLSQMERLVKVTPDDDPQKPDFYFRAAELKAEKQRYFFNKARGLDQKIFDAPAGMKSQLKNEQAGYEKNEQKWLLEAVKDYISATKYKKYPRMDEVLFKLAYLLTSVKKEEQAREFFHRLIKDYPNSKYIPDAYLSFAEYFFNKGEMDNALKFYQKVESFPNASVYPYAVYKEGWCWINLGDFKKALEIFVNVATKLAPNGKGPKAQLQALQKEAKKDIVKAYAHVGGPDKAWEFFQRTGGDFAPRMLEALAELYWEQGKFPDSSKTYRKIISMNMDSPQICGWQFKVVRNTLSAGNKRDQVQEIQRLGAVYDKVREMKGTKKEQLEECRNNYHDTTKELALIWHKEAQKTKNPDTYTLTKYLYKEYLDHFPKEKGAYDLAFYYGELLFVLQEWKDAAEQYTKVVEMNPGGKYTKEAAYAAVISWKNALSIDDEGMRQDSEKARKDNESAKKNDEVPIPEYQVKMISAFDTYIKYVPDAPELVKIKYRKARIFYEYNHFAEAVPLFQDIVEHHTSDELALYSANLMLDSLNALKKTKEVIRWVDRFLDGADGPFRDIMKDKEFAEQMTSLKSDTWAMEAKEYEKAKNFKECGRSMEAAALSKPDHKDHAVRLWDAGQCYQNAHLISQALRLRVALIKDHPKDPLSQKALFRVASGFHQLASYTKAAEQYENFANKFPGEPQAVAALSNAYNFRLGLGESEKAIDDMNAFIKFYGQRKPQDAAAVFFQMGEVYEKEKNYDKLIKHMEDYLKKWGPHGGIDKQILAHFKIGEIYWKGSCDKAGENGACIELKRVKNTGWEAALAKYMKLNKTQKKKIKMPHREQCGPATKAKITVFDRNKKKAQDGQKQFDEVLKLWAKGAAAQKVPAKDHDARVQAAAYAAAGAAFYKAEEQYENFLRVKFPEGLDFSGPSQYDSQKKQDAQKKKQEESNKKFSSFMEDKTKMTLKLVGDPSKNDKGLYGSVVESKVAHWVIASSARSGQIWQNFADQLYTASIPKDLKEVDEWGNQPRQIYCDALEDKAEPIEGKAVEGFELCLKAATQESWFNEWSRLCEKELNQMQPGDYPLASEAKPEPGYVSTTMAPAQLVSELPGSDVGASTAAGSGGGGQQ